MRAIQSTSGFINAYIQMKSNTFPEWNNYQY